MSRRFRTAVKVAASYTVAGLVAYPAALFVSLPLTGRAAFYVFLSALVAVMFGLVIVGDLIIFRRRGGAS